MNTWLPRWHQSQCPVAPWVCWHRACPSLKWVLIEVAPGPFESSGCHAKEEALSLLLPQRMGCPSWFFFFFLLLHHLSQQFLPSDNFADKFSPSYWAVVPSFLNTFLWKVVCFIHGHPVCNNTQFHSWFLPIPALRGGGSGLGQLRGIWVCVML